MTQTAADLVLYHRHGCHLCDDMRQRLRVLEAAWGGRFQVRVVDVDAAPALAQRYGDKVPLLETADGAEICRYWLDEAALRRCLDRSLNE